MKELIFRERFKVARTLIDAAYDPPTRRQWDVLDQIVGELKAPLSREMSGFKKYYESTANFGPRAAPEWGLIKDAYDHMQNFGRWDYVEAKPKTIRRKK